jgi:hypothetical protein
VALLGVSRAKFLKCLTLIIICLLVGCTVDDMSNAWAGDPGGDKTGVATDAQSAAGDAFIVSEPGAKDPEYAKKKAAFDEFQALADTEPLVV